MHDNFNMEYLEIQTNKSASESKDGKVISDVNNTSFFLPGNSDAEVAVEKLGQNLDLIKAHGEVEINTISLPQS